MQEGVCSRCGRELLPLFSAATALAWHCEHCDVYENGTAVHSVVAKVDSVEAWCVAYLKSKRKSSGPKTIQTYYTAA